MTIDQGMTAIGQLGFPIFVATYLLVRMERLLRLSVEHQAKELEILEALKDAVEGK